MQKINEDEMKSAKGKEKWRKFAEKYDGKSKPRLLSSLLTL